MNKEKIGLFEGKKLSIAFIFAIVLANLMFSNGPEIGTIRAQSMNSFSGSSLPKDLNVIQGNSLMAVSSPALASLYPSLSYKASTTCDRMEVSITGYSSTPEQTDDTPFITASGRTVKDGIIANNLLPFGTKVKIPALYGNKVFEVQDRMHWRKGTNQMDIWFPSYAEAKVFGVKRTYIEVID